jgi:UDP-N-acetylmuramoyl-tripeptide--D-alanyl-D-alanine ligase
MKSIFKSLVVSILTFEAKILLRRTKPKIIAVTGSVGKTSAKDAIYHAIKNRVRARKSEKSYNSDIGVPLSILGLDNAWQNPVLWVKNIVDGLLYALWPGNYPEVLVLEMGVDRPGDMKRLARWVKPHIVVLTRLPDVPVHVEYFSSPDAVIAEKLSLVEALSDDGVLIYNHDDEKVRGAATTIRQRSVGYSRYSESDFVVTGDEVIYEQGSPRGLSLKVKGGGEEGAFSLLGAVGINHAYNFAAAAAVAAEFNVGVKETAAAMADFTPPPGRMRLIPGIKDTVIIDDTYNSSPTALERALSTLNEIKGFNRKVAVLGDMLELGRFSTNEHARAGAQAAACCQVLITIGVRARGIAESALSMGMSENNILQYEDAVTAGRELQNIIKAGDLILIKGSQGMRMERIVEDIMAESDRAEELLVRQSRAWKAIS